MSTIPLPDEPSLEQLRNRAKDLQRAVRSGDPAAVAEVAERDPRVEPLLASPAVGSYPLSAAQLVVARRHGFRSWARLKVHVETVATYSRFPDRMAADASDDRADQFLRLACLDYDAVGPAEWASARALLAEHPELTATSVPSAAAAGDDAALAALLAADAAAANRPAGPYRWEPLLYVAYARHDPAIAGVAVVAVTRRLLAAGADPNAGFLWHGLPTPFTALTGAFGEGERGPVEQPRHPHALVLARLLLEAGADPNDGQALYDRMFGPDDSHLELLFAFGLGRGDGGPWHRRLPDALDPPAVMVRGQLWWAVTHAMAARVRLLAQHGVDLASPFDDGRTPTVVAATAGHPDIVDLLVELGAPPPDLSPGRAFVAAALAADRRAIDRLLADDPGVAARVRERRPSLVAWAASNGSVEGVELLVELGFDLDARGRTDVPSDQPWQTALHAAVEAGDEPMVRALLRLGADPNLHDERFDATPLGWAQHFGHDDLVALLEPLTVPDPG